VFNWPKYILRFEQVLWTRHSVEEN